MFAACVVTAGGVDFGAAARGSGTEDRESFPGCADFDPRASIIGAAGDAVTGGGVGFAAVAGTLAAPFDSADFAGTLTASFDSGFFAVSLRAGAVAPLPTL